MKTIPLNFAIVWGAVALSSLAALAGEGTSSSAGNGGQAVVCGTRRNETWALRDLWEIENVGDRNRHVHPIRRTSVPYLVQIRAAVEKVRAVAPDYASALEYTLADIVRPEVRSPIAADVDLMTTHDLGFALQGVSCRTVQLADYNTRLGTTTLWVDDEYIAHLPQTDRAALELHEAIYRIERESFNATNSEHARLVVGLLMSDAPMTRDELFFLHDDPSSSRPILRNARLFRDEEVRWAEVAFADYRTVYTHNGAIEGFDESPYLISIWELLPPSSRSEMTGSWQAKFDGGRNGSFALNLRITSVGHSYSLREYLVSLSDAVLAWRSCEGGVSRAQSFSGPLENTSCRDARLEVRNGIWSRLHRRYLRIYGGSEADFLRYIGTVDTLSSPANSEFGIECKVITVQGDRLLCKWVDRHAYIWGGSRHVNRYYVLTRQ